MDGLLIDSEPIWREVQKDVFAKLGAVLSDEESRATMGLRVDEVVEYWYHHRTWSGLSCKDVENEIIDKVIATVQEKGIPREGVKEILEFMKGKQIKVAIASSSSMKIITAITEHLKIREYFDDFYSAEFEAYGKPHPAVYLTSAKMLDVPVQNCIAFEDSLNGVLAAKSAKMKCVCVPDEALRGSDKLSIADLVLPSLALFNDEIWKQLNN